MTSPSSSTTPGVRHLRRWMSPSSAWQWFIVSAFLTLFWTLASISPVTDKSHRWNSVIGEVLLLSLMVTSLILTVQARLPTRFRLRRFVVDHPQLWVVAAYLGLSSWDIKDIPMCDNGLYFKSILDAVRGFNFALADSLQAMKLQGHPSQGYAAYMMVGQFVAYADSAVANAQSHILAAAAILAFSGIVGFLFPGESRRVQRLLAIGLFAFTPLVYGVSLSMSPDLAVLAFLCLTLYFHMRGKPILAVACATMLSFSKEVGVLLYGCYVIGVYAILLPSRAKHSQGSHLRAYIRNVAEESYLILPLTIFVLYLMRINQIWMFWSPGDLVRVLMGSGDYPYPTSNFNMIYDKTVQILLANFNWVVWGLIAAAAFLALYRHFRGSATPTPWAVRDIWLVILTCTFAPFVLVSFRFLTWNNPRYIVPMSLVEIVLLVRGLEILTTRALVRDVLLSALLALFLVGCFRTIDPILLRAFPTFPLGEHRMSFYNSQRTLCDATVYNREYVYYNRLFDLFIRESGFDATKDEFIFFTSDKLTTWNILNLWTGNDANSRLYVEAGSGTRTYDPKGNALLQYSLISTSGGTNPLDLPAHAYSIKLFWSKKLETSTDALVRGYYRVVREIHVDENGYSLDGYELVRRVN